MTKLGLCDMTSNRKGKWQSYYLDLCSWFFFSSLNEWSSKDHICKEICIMPKTRSASIHLLTFGGKTFRLVLGKFWYSLGFDLFWFPVPYFGTVLWYLCFTWVFPWYVALFLYCILYYINIVLFIVVQLFDNLSY